MAAYEVLLLNTVVPQIQAAQAGDSYVMVVNATTPALRITQTGTGDSILVEDAANPDSSPFVVTAAGDVGIGTASPTFKLQVIGTSQLSLSAAGTQQALQLNNSDTTAGTQAVKLGFSSAGVTKASINAAVYGNDYMTFNVGSDTERARITSGGYFKASDTGSYNNGTGSFHELYQTSSSEPAVVVTLQNASYVGNGLFVEAARNTTNNSFYAINYYNSGAGAFKFRVADSGDVTNTNGTYGTISDQKMKTDIVDAGSQWSDIKALRFRKFKMKNDPQQIVQLGVVAQEVELTSPGLVDEHTDRDAEGNDLGTTTKSVKTSVLLMKAAVALQEAMSRIETLEAKIAALEAK